MPPADLELEALGAQGVVALADALESLDAANGGGVGHHVEDLGEGDLIRDHLLNLCLGAVAKTDPRDVELAAVDVAQLGELGSVQSSRGHVAGGVSDKLPEAVEERQQAGVGRCVDVCVE